jgi:DNA invertase Pin-like site-specific DNA recombinase
VVAVELGRGAAAEEGFDPSTALGKAMLTVAAAFAQMEHELNLERTHAGLEAARARGRNGGRPRKMTPRKAEVARRMYAEVGGDGRRVHTVQEIADTVGVSRKTVYSYLELA